MTYNPKDHIALDLHLSEIEVGYQAELSHTIVQEDLDSFSVLTGDFSPIHVDPEYARNTLFGKPIVHGMLTSSFVSTLIGMLLPGRRALWTDQTFCFIKPVFVDDTITVRATVKQVSEATRTIVTEVEITNQNNVCVVAGQSTIRVLESKGERKKSAAKTKKVKSTAKPGAKSNKACLEKAVVLITGGSGGIGTACAESLAAEGFPVAVNYFKNRSSAEALVSAIIGDGGLAITVEGDVSDKNQVYTIFDAIESSLGPVGGLVHCAAPEPFPQEFANTDWSVFDKMLQVQIGGAHHCVTRALPNMMNDGGSIVFVGSIYGDSVPPTQQSAYVTVKSAVAGLARAMAFEFGPKGVRVNVVAPGMTQTAMITGLPAKAKELARMSTPLRNLAEPQDVADAVTFLIGDKAKHITGETLHVCGGVTMG
jgi:3-oxoacyl-[acyl-carrier protein] reductase